MGLRFFLLSEVGIEGVKEWYLILDLVGMCVQRFTEIACFEAFYSKNVFGEIQPAGGAI